MKAAILGTGFPALIAAYAVEKYCDATDQPSEVVLYGQESTPERHGARWYEREIPGLKIKSAMVTVQAVGDVDDYIAKLNGPLTEYNRPRPDFLAFDYHEANLLLHNRFADRMSAMGINPKNLDEFSWDDCDFVFSTIPRPAFFGREESKMFAATRHWRLDEPSDQQRFAQEGDISKNICIFDGSKNSGWYRVMQTFGLISVEWPFDKKPPLEDLYTEILPLSAAPDLKLRNVDPLWRAKTTFAHVGPLARWSPCTDLGEVYFDVMKVLRRDFDGGETL